MRTYREKQNKLEDLQLYTHETMKIYKPYTLYTYLCMYNVHTLLIYLYNICSII